jgi:hypothetical protein
LEINRLKYITGKMLVINSVLDKECHAAEYRGESKNVLVGVKDLYSPLL